MSAFWLLFCGAAVVVIFGDVSKAGELPAGAVYLGCYEESRSLGSSDFTVYGSSSSSMTRKLCINYCTGKGYQYSALSYGRRCYCGNGYGRHGRAPRDSDCNRPCRGDQTEMCGGRYKNSVFSNSKVPGGAVYLGCYKESRSYESRDFNVYMSNDAMTRKMCIDHCKGKGYQYSALRSGSLCYCGNSYGRHGKTMNDSDCDKPCLGNKWERCGGDWENSVFSNQRD